MNTVFLGIIAFVLLAWFIRSSRKPKGQDATQKIPSYKEMLEMSDEELKEWLFLFNSSHRDNLLTEMIDFEEKNHVAQKEREHKEKQLSASTQRIYDLFNKNKSGEVLEWLNKLGETTGKDLVSDALLAKMAMDKVFTKSL